MSPIRFMENLAIRNKIALAFAGVLILVVALGGAAAMRLSAVSQTVDTLAGDSIVGINQLDEMRASILRFRLAVAHYIIAKVASPDFNVAIDTALANYRKQDALYAPTATDPREKVLYDTIRSDMQAYLDAAMPAVALYNAGKMDEAWATYQANDGIGKAEALEKALTADRAFNSDAADSLMQEADQRYRSGLKLILGLLSASVILAGGLGYLLVRSIAHPMVRTAQVLTQLSQRHYDFVLRLDWRRDEIGMLSRATDTLRNALQEGDRLAAEQQAAQAAKARRQAAMEQHTQDFGNSISGVMASLAAAAVTMREAAEAMSNAAGVVHSEAEETAAGAAKSSRDLTTVAAAVEELNSSVAEVSRQLAEATEVAQQAVQRAEASHATMQGLSEATGRIGDVVSLISDIAGQTNLLALNATIEAARAGEAGKGFAVVAGEVKTLAAQTAKATSEIAAQIETVRSATGEAVTAMADIGGIIGKMNGVAAAIAAAVEEQSATMRDISGSVQGVASATAASAEAMANVVAETEQAGSISRNVLAGAGEIGKEAEKLRVEVDDFLAAVRGDSTDERRRYQRLEVQGVMVGLRTKGQADTRVALCNVSRGGAALRCDWTLPAGTELTVELPEAGGPVPARVVRCGGGELALVFASEPQALARIDRALNAMAEGRQAA